MRLLIDPDADLDRQRMPQSTALDSSRGVHSTIPERRIERLSFGSESSPLLAAICEHFCTGASPGREARSSHVQLSRRIGAAESEFRPESRFRSARVRRTPLRWSLASSAFPPYAASREDVAGSPTTHPKGSCGPLEAEKAVETHRTSPAGSRQGALLPAGRDEMVNPNPPQ